MYSCLPKVLTALQFLFVSQNGLVQCFTQHTSYSQARRNPRLTLVAPGQNVATAHVPTLFSREEAQVIIHDQLMPQKGYSERIGWGRDAQGLGDNNGPLNPSDPRLTMTYAEFPLESWDELIDLGLRYLPQKKINDERLSFVDIGSGCGRIAFYSAMTRGSIDRSWNVHGIEISTLLHEKALQYMQKGVQNDIFSLESPPDGSNGTISLIVGPVEDHSALLKNADVIFAYSTAFPANQFLPDLGALVLDPEWSALLSQICSVGCVAVTTDRALDPVFNWELVDRLDVKNPELFGTTGYIHILRG